MKQEANENGYLVASLLATFFFAIASIVILLTFSKNNEIEPLFWYGLFAGLWGAGALLGIIGGLSHRSIFWALSFLAFYSYFVVFSFHYGTLIQAINGIVGEESGNNARFGSIAISAVLILNGVLAFLGLLLRKKPLIVTALVLTIFAVLYLGAEFVFFCQSSFGQGKEGWQYMTASILSAIATLTISAAFLIILISSIGQIDLQPENVGRIIEEALEGQKDRTK
jgi:hypothetical protein